MDKKTNPTPAERSTVEINIAGLAREREATAREPAVLTDPRSRPAMEAVQSEQTIQPEATSAVANRQDQRRQALESETPRDHVAALPEIEPTVAKMEAMHQEFAEAVPGMRDRMVNHTRETGLTEMAERDQRIASADPLERDFLTTDYAAQVKQDPSLGPTLSHIGETLHQNQLNTPAERSEAMQATKATTIGMNVSSAGVPEAAQLEEPGTIRGANASASSRTPEGYYRVETQSGEMQYRDKETHRLAFTDRGGELKVSGNRATDVSAAMDVAQQKGWERVETEGPTNFRAEAYAQASQRAITVEGYQPTAKARDRVNNLRMEAERAQERQQDISRGRDSNREKDRDRERD